MRIGLALSGGGSRAMAFHLGCLRALDRAGVLDRIAVMSTISGGSVIGAYYAYTPEKSFRGFEGDIRRFLRAGFNRSILLEAIKPWNLVPGMVACGLSHVQDVWRWLSRYEPPIRRFRSRTDAFEAVLRRKLFAGLLMGAPRRRNIEFVIGACELRSGTAFRFGHEKSGAWRLGELDDNAVPVAFAVTASAAYPILLPAFDRTLRFRQQGKTQAKRVLLTDGGVYDNLGIQVLEPGRDPKVSLHTYPCDYIISCNAGHGQDDGLALPLGFGARVARAFAVVHRRVQDSAMHRLHGLKAAGTIRGFAMPYLGQQDASLPSKPDGFVPRERVMTYPTDFAAMPEEWIETLSNRGEQLTHLLIEAYLPELLH